MSNENATSPEDLKRDAMIKKGEMFSVLADLAQVGICVADQQGKYVYVNPYWAGISGLKAEETLGDGWIKSVHPADRDAVLAEWNKAISTGAEFRSEYRLQHSDGKIVWVYSVADPQRDTSGAVVRYAAMAIDISKRKESEEKLKTSEIILRNSQQVAGLGSYVMDVKTGQWIGSEVLDQVLGVDAGHEHSTAEWVSLLHPDDRVKTKDYLDMEVIEKAQPFDKEYRIIRPSDKEVRWVHGLGKLDLDANGHPTKLYGTVQDITERKNEKDALQKQFEEVEKLNSIMMGRELRMVELKTEIEELKEKLAEQQAISKV